MLHNDATELCAALLVAVGMTISYLTLIIALPFATLLQRSFRHAQLLNEARADAKTGLLNAATWEREAAAESPGRSAPTRRSPWPCSTWTGSSRSTTPTATCWAMRCCARSPTR